MPLTSEHLTFARQRTEGNYTTFAHGTGVISDYKRCSMTCIIIIIVILALGFIVLFAFIIRKCNERTLALRTRIQSFIVSEPGSLTLDREQELEEVEVANLEDDGDPILISVTNKQEKQTEENCAPMTTEVKNISSDKGKPKEDSSEVEEGRELEKKGAID